MSAEPKISVDARINDQKYPAGKFVRPDSVTPEELAGHIETIAAMPVRLRAAVAGLSPDQLNTPYREGGWTIRQVVHHVPDSHLNAYVRMKLALTEDEPVIKSYDEAAWAMLSDSDVTPIEISLALLASLHERWVNLMRGLTPDDWKRAFRHPQLGVMQLDVQAALYAWHARHHTAHVTALRARMGW